MKKQIITLFKTHYVAQVKNKKLYWGFFLLSNIIALFLINLIRLISGYFSLWFAFLFGNLFVLIIHYKLYNQFNKSKYKIKLK